MSTLTRRGVLPALSGAALALSPKLEALTTYGVSFPAECSGLHSMGRVHAHYAGQLWNELKTNSVTSRTIGCNSASMVYAFNHLEYSKLRSPLAHLAADIARHDPTWFELTDERARVFSEVAAKFGLFIPYELFTGEFNGTKFTPPSSSQLETFCPTKLWDLEIALLQEFDNGIPNVDYRHPGHLRGGDARLLNIKRPPLSCADGLAIGGLGMGFGTGLMVASGLTIVTLATGGIAGIVFFAGWSMFFAGATFGGMVAANNC